MRINKKKLFLILAFAFVFAALFATSAFALEDESITVTYKTSVGLNHSYGTVNVKGGVAFNLEKGDFPEDKTAKMGYSYIWVTDDGHAYEAGTKVIFYENTVLTPVLAYDVSTYDEFIDYCAKFDDSDLTADDFKSLPENGITVRLLKDITIVDALEHKTTLGAVMNFVLNGRTLTIDKSLDGALGGERFGTRFYGSGTVKYEGSGALVRLNSHSVGGNFNVLLVGSGVYLNAPNATLGKDTSKEELTAGYPDVAIYGTVNCKNVLEITGEKNRSAKINIGTTAFLTLSGELLVKGSTENKIHVSVTGGTIVTTNSGVAFFSEDNSYSLSGGSFLFAKSTDYTDKALKNLPTGYRSYTKWTANGKTYTTILKEECQKAGKFTEGKYDANCAHATQVAYKCGTCSKVHYISYGAPNSTHVLSEDKKTTDATATQIGMIISTCTLCSCKDYEFLIFDPSNVDVQIEVLVDGQSKNLSVKVKDLFDLDTNYAITSIKDFQLAQTPYTASQVIKITIPAGIKGLNISTDNESIKTLVFDSNVDLEVVSIAKLSALETIELRAVRVKFLANCAPDSLKAIKSNKTTAKITFDDNAFNGKTNLQELVFCGLSDYVFGASSFKGTGVKNLNLVDNATYRFTGEGAFAESKVETIYVGRGVKSLDKKAFISMPNLNKIVLMDVTSIVDGEFSSLKDGCVVYHHAATLTLGEKTFEKNKDITIYTKAEITKGFFESTYTIVKNITHAYTLKYTAPTCTSIGSNKYVTDCPCGANNGTKTMVYKNIYTNAEEGAQAGQDYTDETLNRVPHNPSVGTVIRYENGYTKGGMYAKECTMCKDIIASTATACDPLVRSVGYSVCEDGSGNGSMTVRYVLNIEVFKEYAKTLGNNFEYGTLFAAKKPLGDKTPLKSGGVAESGVYKIKATASNGVASYTLKVANLNDAQKELEFIMCIYIIEEGKIFYIQDNEIVENPSGVAYNEVKELADYKEMMQAG